MTKKESRKRSSPKSTQSIHISKILQITASNTTLQGQIILLIAP